MSALLLPKRLVIQSFKCFAGEVRLTFPADGELLGVISGGNQVEQELGANGAGKSTLWDALSWCLFGQTLRGLRGKDIRPWGDEGASPRVEFQFERGGEFYRIARSQKPNIVMLYNGFNREGESIGQARVEELVGLNFTLFANTIVQAQFGESFLDLTPQRKLDFLSAALSLNVFEDASKQAKADAAEQAASVTEAEKNTSAKASALDEVRNTRQASQAKIVELRRARRESEPAEDGASELREELARLEDHARTLKAEMAENAEALNMAAREISKLQRAKTKATAADARARERFRSAERKVDSLRGSLRAVKRLSGSCPTCHTKVTPKTRDAATRALRETIDAEKAAARARRRRAARASKKSALIAKRWEKAGHAYGRLEDRVDSARSKLSKARAALAATKAKLEESSANEDTKLLSAFLADQVAELTTRAKELTEELSQSQRSEKVQRRKLQRLQHWIGGFRDIRLWIIRSALDELEALANSHLLDLGLRGWRINFEVERATQSGSLVKGFTVSIVSPLSPEAVPWKGWSGGELQRLKIAAQAAMIDLVRSRMGGGWAFEVWDEPTAHLSASGIGDLTRFFRERARALQFEVWIVDHRTLSGGEFTYEIRVTKDPTGSTIHQHRR